jgi:peroxiredoxin
MPYLVTGLIAVATLASLNLFLTLGITRRMRRQADAALSHGSGPVSEPQELILEVGKRPADFVATTVDGRELSLASLAGPALVGFFAPRCSPCEAWIPRFAEAAAAMSATGGQALAVVVGRRDEAEKYVSALGGSAHVVVEQSTDGPLSNSFAVQGYPSMVRLDVTGTVASNSNHDVVAAPALA